MAINPRITDIATRVDRLQSEGFPLLAAFSRVAESLDLDVSTIDRCYGIALCDAYDVESENPYYRDDSSILSHSHDTPDPFDIEADWNENLSR